jgi:hypothetical protein
MTGRRGPQRSLDVVASAPRTGGVSQPQAKLLLEEVRDGENAVHRRDRSPGR